MTETNTHNITVSEISDKDDIKHQIEDLIEELEEASQSEEANEKLNELMSQVGSLGVERYSSRNQMALWSQVLNRDDVDTGEAKYFHGYKTWQNEYGRQVEKGTDGFKILTPIIARKCPECGNSPDYHDNDWVECDELDDEETDPEEDWSVGVVGYRTGTVFEYNQTVAILDENEAEDDELSLDDVEADEAWEPTELSAEGDASALNDAVRSVIADRGIELRKDSKFGRVKGTSQNGTITLSEELDEATETKVLIHELAHEMMHWDDESYPTEQKEVEAEAVAFAVCSRYGVETDSDAYVSSWDSDEVATWNRIEEITTVAEAIITDVNEIIDE
jgi:hypothetical protein